MFEFKTGPARAGMGSSTRTAVAPPPVKQPARPASPPPASVDALPRAVCRDCCRLSNPCIAGLSRRQWRSNECFCAEGLFFPGDSLDQPHWCKPFSDLLAADEEVWEYA
jgi:hypothetical protein